MVASLYAFSWWGFPSLPSHLQSVDLKSPRSERPIDGYGFPIASANTQQELHPSIFDIQLLPLHDRRYCGVGVVTSFLRLASIWNHIAVRIPVRDTPNDLALLIWILSREKINAWYSVDKRMHQILCSDWCGHEIKIYQSRVMTYCRSPVPINAIKTKITNSRCSYHCSE